MRSWVGDRLVEAADAVVSVHDAGFRLGHGVFGTLRVAAGEPVRLDLHVDRLRRDAERSGITPPPTSVLEDAARRTASANASDHPDHVLRLQLTAGAPDADAPFGSPAGDPLLVVTSTPPPVAPVDAPVAVTLVERGGRRPADVKSTSYAGSTLALATARATGADTALLCEDGGVLEAATANVVVLGPDGMRTPVADGRLLPGTTRGLLLSRVSELHEAAVGVAEVPSLTEMVLCSAVRGIVPVRTVDGRALPTVDGPLAERLRAALWSEGWPRRWPTRPGR